MPLLKVNPNIEFAPLFWAISALIVGVIYTKINKQVLSRNQRIKISLYSLLILLTLFLTIMFFMLDLFNAKPFHLIVRLLTMILPTILIIISGICLYPALNLGCKIANTDKSKNIEKSTKLQDCLLIIFCFVLGMFVCKFNDLALDAVKPTIIKYMEQKGYIRKIKPVQVKTMLFKDKTSISGVDYISTTNYANTNF